jgi:hypothetical protein
MPRSPTAMAPGGDQPGADCVRHLEAARTGIVLDRTVGPGLGESPPIDPASSSASAPCIAAYDAVDGHEQIADDLQLWRPEAESSSRHQHPADWSAIVWALYPR